MPFLCFSWRCSNRKRSFRKHQFYTPYGIHPISKIINLRWFERCFYQHFHKGGNKLIIILFEVLIPNILGRTLNGVFHHGYKDLPKTPSFNNLKFSNANNSKSSPHLGPTDVIDPPSCQMEQRALHCSSLCMHALSGPPLVPRLIKQNPEPVPH